MNLSQYTQIHQDIARTLKNVVASLSNEQQDTIELFNTCLDKFLQLSTYDKCRWHATKTQMWWEDLETLSKSDYCTQFLYELNIRIPSCTELEVLEPLQFVRIELLFNSGIPKEKLIEAVDELIINYPSNLEFQHSHAHLLKDLSKDPLCEQNLLALSIYRKYILAFSSPHYPVKVVRNTYNYEIKLFQTLRDNKKYIDAESLLDSMSSFPPYIEDPLFCNNTITIKQQFDERLHLEGTMKEQLKQYQDELEKSRAAQSNQNMQQLSIFSAIITFIITAATTDISTINGFGSLAVFGIVLVMFVITASILSNPPKKFLSDIRGYLLLGFGCICILLVGAVYFTQKDKIEINCLVNCHSSAYFPRLSEDSLPPGLDTN